MKYMLSALAGAAMMCAAGSATQAATIRFDNFAESGTILDGRGFVVTEAGYQLTNSASNPLSFIQWANSATLFGFPVHFDADPNDPLGHTLSVAAQNSTTTLTSLTTAAFDFLSIDFADMFNSGATGNISLSWDFTGGGSGGTIVSLDALAGLQTFSINALDVTAVRIAGLTTPGTFLQMDNINVRPHNDGAVSAVPLPAGLPMLLTGLGGIVFMGRRRHRHAA